MDQYLITPAAGKRLIAKALVTHPDVKKVLSHGTVIIVAGTTNGYVAEEILSSIGQSEDFERRRFFRGITLSPSTPSSKVERLSDESKFPGDVVLVKGIWIKGRTIFDVVDDMKEGDIILKGANALDITRRQAAVYIGHPQAGTIGVAMQAVVGRRVHLILPVGLEKRVAGNLQELAIKLNQAGCKGPRLFPVPGEVFTELDAVTSLTGASAFLVAGGGVAGAEGSVWIAVDGTSNQMTDVESLMKSVSNEPAFEL